jgi:hypothetical protein
VAEMDLRLMKKIYCLPREVGEFNFLCALIRNCISGPDCLLAGRLLFPTITQQGTQNEFQIENFTRFLQIVKYKFGTVDREKE